VDLSSVFLKLPTSRKSQGVHLIVQSGDLDLDAVSPSIAHVRVRSVPGNEGRNKINNVLDRKGVFVDALVVNVLREYTICDQKLFTKAMVLLLSELPLGLRSFSALIVKMNVLAR
jgi:hypothetical protein